MGSPEKKILKILCKEKTILRKDLERKIKVSNVSQLINWLFENGYIEKDYSIGGEEILKITEPGIIYKNDIDAQTIKKWSMRLLIPTAILAVLTIMGIIIKPFSIKNNSEKITSSIEANDTTFFLKYYYSFNGLVDSIEKKSNFVHSISSNNIFEITYSGEPNMIRENYYCYSGGNLVIKLKGNIVLSIDSLKIEKTNPDGTLQNVINEELDNRVERIVLRNKIFFTKEIISLLEQNTNQP